MYGSGTQSPGGHHGDERHSHLSLADLGQVDGAPAGDDRHQISPGHAQEEAPVRDVLPFVPDVGAGLVSRSAETAVLHSFVERFLTSGAALLVTGDPGVGKSALLDVAEQEATTAGATVVHAEGVEFEAEVSFAGLNQILLPLLGHLDALPEPHQEALAVALG